MTAETVKDIVEETAGGRLTAVEIKIAYLEDFLTKLQSIAVEQGAVIDRLQGENRLMKNKIKELSDNQEGDIPNVRPPHY